MVDELRTTRLVNGEKYGAAWAQSTASLAML